MAYSSLSNVVEEIRAKTDAIMSDEPEEIRAFRTGSLDNKAGSFGQYFGTWDIAAGMMRDYSMYTYYPLVQLVENESIALDQFISHSSTPSTILTATIFATAAFPEMGHLAFALRDGCPRAALASEAVEAVRAFCMYTNKLAAWSFHYFPWGLGKHFSYAQPRGAGAFDRRSVLAASASRTAGRSAYLGAARRDRGCPSRGEREPGALPGYRERASRSRSCRTMPWSLANRCTRGRLSSPPLLSAFASASATRRRAVSASRSRPARSSSSNTGRRPRICAQPVLGEIIPEHAAGWMRSAEGSWESTFETKELIWMTVEARRRHRRRHRGGRRPDL